MPFAQFGNIVFENMKSPTSMNIADSATWVQFDNLNSKPVMQKTGDELRKISMSVTLRQDFCIVKTELENFYKYKDAGESASLFLGDGTVLGTFVITDIAQDYKRNDPISGAMIEVGLSVSFLEYVVRNPLQQEQNKAIQNSPNIKAATSKNPNPKKKTYANSCDKNITAIWQQLNSNYNQLGVVLKKLIIPSGITLFTARQLCNQILTTASGLAQSDGSYPCISSQTALQQNAQSIVFATDEVKTALNDPTAARGWYDGLLTPAMLQLKALILKNIQNSITG